MDIRNILAVGATPALQAILNALGQLKLEPLAHWGISQQALLPATYVVSAASAAIACLWSAKTKLRQMLLIAVGLVFFIISWAGYHWVSSSPPEIGSVLLFDWLGCLSFILTYVSFGFLVARVVKFFAQA